LSRPREAHRGGYSQHPLQLGGKRNQDGSGLEADFTTERKKLKEDHNDTKRELARLKQLCAKNQIDTSTRKQKEEQKGA
jgi:hypothetical protein